jgi:hypothetical protein
MQARNRPAGKTRKHRKEDLFPFANRTRERNSPGPQRRGREVLDAAAEAQPWLANREPQQVSSAGSPGSFRVRRRRTDKGRGGKLGNRSIKDGSSGFGSFSGWSNAERGWGTGGGDWRGRRTGAMFLSGKATGAVKPLTGQRAGGGRVGGRAGGRLAGTGDAGSGTRIGGFGAAAETSGWMSS